MKVLVMSELERPVESGKLPVILRQIAKYGAFALLALVVFAGAFAAFLYYKAERAIDRIGVPDPEPEPAAEAKPPSPSAPVEPEPKAKPLTILLMGLDYRKETRSMNTDVIMVAALNPERRSATIVSLPRDLLLKPPGLPERKANYYFPYFYNQDRESAFRKTKEVFADYLQIPIDHMATIDFQGFVKVVDELGGLTIDVDMDMRYVDKEDGTNIDLKKGVQTLTGKQTLDFVRYRHSNTPGVGESSDFARNQRQQQVLDQMLGKLKSAGGILKLGQIIDAVGDSLKTDIPSSQIRELIKTYFGIERENVRFLPMTGVWKSPYVIVDEEQLLAVRQALRSELGDMRSPYDDTNTRNAGKDAANNGSAPSGSGNRKPATVGQNVYHKD